MDRLEGIVLEGIGGVRMIVSESLFWRLNIVCIAAGAFLSVSLSPRET